MSLQALSTTVLQCQGDIRSTKVLVRQKSLEKLDQIFNNRESELIELLTGNVFDAPTTWAQLFDSAHEAIIQQSTKLSQDKETATAVGRNASHINVLQKIANTANKSDVLISYDDILEKCFHCFSTGSISKHFGVCYLQILKKNILSSKGNLNEIKINQWSRLISYCFQMYEKNVVSRLVILESLALIVEYGCENSYLYNDLKEYLPKIELMVEDDHMYNAQKELIKCIFYFCKYLALDYRHTICQFIENILGPIIKMFNNKLDDEIKTIFYKLFHLSVIIHSPESNIIDIKSDYIVDNDKWYRHLRNLFHLLQSELKQYDGQQNRFQQILTINENLVMFAASLCSVIFWNDRIWNQSSIEEQSNKRKKYSNKLEGIMDLIEFEKGKFNWGWLTVLYIIIKNHPNSFTVIDFQPLLQLLVDFQTTIQQPIQINILINICNIAIQKQKSFNNCALISEDFCNKSWNNILQKAFSTSTKIENIKLIHLFFVHNHNLSSNFASTIIKTILSNNIQKSESSLAIMISTYQNININTLEYADDLRKDTLNWLYSKMRASDLKHLMLSDQVELSMESIAELTVLSIFSKIKPKQPKEICVKIGQSNDSEFNIYIDKLRKNILRKSLEVLIVDKSKNVTTSFQCENNINSIAQIPLNQGELQSVINEDLFEYLFGILNVEESEDNTPPSNYAEIIVENLRSIALFLNILNKLIEYESLHAERIHKIFLTKKILLKLSTVNITIANLINKDSAYVKDDSDILKKLMAVFNDKFHPDLQALIKDVDLMNVIDWLGKHISWNDRRHSKYIHIQSSDKLEFHHQMRSQSFLLLSYFNSGRNSEITFNLISEYDFNFYANPDLSIVHEILCQEMKNVNPSESRVNWILDLIKILCQTHHRNRQISRIIIHLLPDIIRFVKNFPINNDCMYMIISSFLKQGTKRKYNMESICNLVLALKYVARDYSHLLLDDSWSSLFHSLKTFLSFELIEIEFAVVDALISIFDPEWISHGSSVNSQSYKNFHLDLFEMVQTSDLFDNEEQENDVRQRVISVLGQLFCGVICKNHLLRKKSWFLFAKLCSKKQISLNKVRHLISLISSILNIIEPSTLINENIFYLVSMWLKTDHMSTFPWYLTNCETQSDFFYDHLQTITYCILQCNPTILDEFVEIIPDETRQSLLEPILPKCIAFLLPVLGNCSTISSTYKSNALSVHQILTDNFANLPNYFISKSVDIVENLLLNLWDNEQFVTFFGFSIDVDHDEQIIDYLIFNSCLEYLQNQLKATPSTIKIKNILIDFCINQPKRMNELLLSIKMHYQMAKFEGQKLYHLYHYCVIIEHITKYLIQIHIGPKATKDEFEYNKEFFIRDTIYFISNQLLSPDIHSNVELALSRYFLQFFQSILPKCSQLFGPYLNFIVCTLTPLVQRNDNTMAGIEFSKCLRFLIEKQQNVFINEIANLPNFPEKNVFDELKRIHLSIKYKNGTFNLSQEIDNFLKVDGQKLEGLISLREHLSSKKDDLFNIFEKLQDKSYSDSSSNIPKLVDELLQIVQRNDPKRSYEAAKCLGEIGPCNLFSIALRENNEKCCYSSNLDDAIQNLYEVAIEKLDRLLLHPDVRVLKAVSSALSFLFKSVEYQNIGKTHRCTQIFKSQRQMHTAFSKNASRLELLELFKSNEDSSYAVWIKKFASKLLNIFNNTQLEAVVLLQVSFADNVLPPLINMVLSLKNEHFNNDLKEVVQMFFKQHFELTQEDTTTTTSATIYTNKAILKTMLNVVEHIRMYNLNNIVDQINLEYIHIAKAAQYCEAYFSSILYCELWAEQQVIGRTELLNNKNLQNIMQTAYSSIGQTTAIMPFLDPVQSRFSYYQLNNSWERIILERDASNYRQIPTSEPFEDYFSSAGLYALSNSIQNSSKTVSAGDFECAWRLGNWEILTEPLPTSKVNHLLEFERHHYCALKSVQLMDKMGCKNSISEARNSIITFLKTASLECTNNIYQHLRSLALLQQVEDFCEIQFPDEKRSEILEKWKHQDQIQMSDFKHKETILAQRLTLFKSAGIRASRTIRDFYHTKDIADVSHRTVINLSKMARKEDQTHIATIYLATLRPLEMSADIKARLFLEDGCLNWKLGDTILAKKLLNCCIQTQNVEASFSKLIALRKFGKYLAESNSETIKNVINQNFKPLIDGLTEFEKNKDLILSKVKLSSDSEFSEIIKCNRVKAYGSIAKYADREYNQIATYMKSSTFEKKKKYVNVNQNNIQTMSDATKDLKTSKTILCRSTRIDENEMKIMENEKNEYLLLALENYFETCILELGPSSSIVFRIISLWFTNKSKVNVNDIIRRYMPKVASFKFIPVVPQISARISNSSEDFHKIVCDLIERCAIDHPHHTLHQILALSNAYADATSSTKLQKEDGRVAGAHQLLVKLRKKQQITLIVSQMEDMSKALIQLSGKESSKISSKEPLYKLKNLNYVNCPTITLPIIESGNYQNFISIVKWSNKIENVGGINAPKKLYCLCSDGRERPQLLKGLDDLRQDAVMQQVFTIMNTMLNSNKKTMKDNLRIRTYKVIPLSQRSGILEWCQNSIPLSEYLIGSGRKLGAHQRFRPGDLQPKQCRDILCDSLRKPYPERLKIYKKICEKFQPVFQYFFYENFHTPGQWFDRRLAYTNSVATTSMIGYILGIGDRHVSNILIDCSTAELLHIDFGIAFEQGKCLPTPESVPFRLTRDIVAPFGVSQVDGVFRKSCEKTLQVLRQNKATILTILEVLLYDPLYAWALTDKEVCSRQGIQFLDDLSDEDSGDRKNTMAERALLRLEAKLDGQESGTIGGALTVKSHVEMLIRDAMSPNNLCRLFYGWQANL